MKIERLTFPNAQGVPLAAQLDLPAEGEAQAFALFAHCFTCGKNLGAMSQVSRELTRGGIGVLRFDFTGLGGSGGDFSETTFSSNVSDLQAAARFLEAAGRPPALLIGHSLGGAAVLRAAAAIPSVRAVATIGAPAAPDHILRHLKGGLGAVDGEAEVLIAGRTVRLGRSFLDEISGISLEQSIRDLGRALLVLHAPRDAVVGVENAATIFQAARHPKSFLSLDDADHLLTRAADARYAGALIAVWAGRYMDLPEHETEASASTMPGVQVQVGGSGYRVEIRAGRHRLVADEPSASGGGDTGPTPHDLLLASLGACTAMTLRMYADRKGWPLEGITVELSRDRIAAAECPACRTREGQRDRLTRVLSLQGPLDGEQRKRLLQIAERCPVHRTLISEIVIESRLR
jgi:putative redox protein